MNRKYNYYIEFIILIKIFIGEVTENKEDRDS